MDQYLVSDGCFEWTQELFQPNNRKEDFGDGYCFRLDDCEPTSVLDLGSRLSPPLECTCHQLYTGLGGNNLSGSDTHPNPSCPHAHICWGKCPHPVINPDQPCSQIDASPTLETDTPYYSIGSNLTLTEVNFLPQGNVEESQFLWTDDQLCSVPASQLQQINSLPAYIQHNDIQDAYPAGLCLNGHPQDLMDNAGRMGTAFTATDAESMEMDKSAPVVSWTDTTSSLNFMFPFSSEEEDLADSFINHLKDPDRGDESIISSAQSYPVRSNSMTSLDSRTSSCTEDDSKPQFNNAWNGMEFSATIQHRQAAQSDVNARYDWMLQEDQRACTSPSTNYGTTAVPAPSLMVEDFTSQAGEHVEMEKNCERDLLSQEALMELLTSNDDEEEQVLCTTSDKADHGLRLVHLLLACAEAVAWRDLPLAASLLERLRMSTSYTGDSIERVVCCFTEGLSARFASMSTRSVLRPQLGTLFSSDERMESLLQLHQCSPYISFGIFAANESILQACERKKQVHIVDLGMLQNLQWPGVLRALAARPEGPPHVRITAIGGKLSDLNGWGRELAEFANTLNVPFEFKAAAEALDISILTPTALGIRKGETLAINSILQLHRMVKESRGTLKNVLQALRKLGPTVVTVVEQDANHNGPFFLGRFLEALHYYSAIFDSLEARLERGSKQRMVVEREYYGAEIRNIVACEGGDRVERHEKAEQWRRQLSRAGFQAVPLKFMSQAHMMLSLYDCDEFTLAPEKGGGLVLGWKGRPIVFASAWKCPATALLR